jgi:hypothetical protein
MPMKNFILLTTSIILLSLTFADRSESAAKKPHIADLRLRQGDNQVLLSAVLAAEFDDEMRQAIRGGVPLKFWYKIRLTSKGSIIGERVVRNRELIHGLEYDPVRQLYLFTAEGYSKKNFERTTKDEEEALKWLTTIEDWPLYALEKLERKTRYRVRVMATLRSVELPSVLGYIFFFTTIFNRETPWVQVDFTY